MANKQMNQLATLTSVASDDLLLVYDVDGSGTEKTKNILYSDFETQISGAVGGLTEIPNPLEVGVDDVTNGVLELFAASSGASGAKLIIHQAGGYDESDGAIQFYTDEETLKVGNVGGGQIMFLRKSQAGFSVPFILDGGTHATSNGTLCRIVGQAPAITGGTGGDLTLISGRGGGNGVGQGGTLNLEGGDGRDPTLPAGAVIVTGGPNVGNGAGGDVTIKGGDSGPAGDVGGNVTLRGGGGGTSGVVGMVIIDSPLTILERSADPTEPTEGESVIWMSDGTGKGDDGDVLIASKAGGVTKYGTLFDHSAGAAW